MQSRWHNFYFGQDFSFGTDNVFVYKLDNGAEGKPKEDDFLLLAGPNFLLLNGSNFLLL